jgi:hypothetical protein
MPSALAYSVEVSKQVPARLILLKAFIKSGSTHGLDIDAPSWGRHLQGKQIIRFLFVTVFMSFAVAACLP